MKALLAVLSWLVPSPALGGAPHTRAYEATVLAADEVKSFELEDRWAGLGPSAVDLPITLRVKAAACRIRIQVTSDYRPLGGKPIDVYASKEACRSIRPGLRTQAQYFGLADMFRVVAIQIDGAWRALPLMRLTTSMWVLDCFASRDQECAGVHLEAPL
jgi:hypothetical protein